MSLANFFLSLSAPLAKKALASLGFGLVSYAGVSVAVGLLLDQAKTAFSGLPSDVLMLIAISGVPQALSIIAGAITARGALKSFTRLEILK